MKLVVVQPFAGRQVGDEITEPAEVEAIRGGEHALHVVAVATPEPESEESEK
jgi:hypothetical protein